MKIIIHIGTHKTGRTAIQHYFNNNRQSLYSSGLYYPQGQESWPGHPRLDMQIKSRNDIAARECIVSVLKDAENQKCGRVFISSEVFAHVDATRHDKFKIV